MKEQYQKAKQPKQSKRKRNIVKSDADHLPEWVEEQKQQSQEQQNEVLDLEEERRRLEEELKMYIKA